MAAGAMPLYVVQAAQLDVPVSPALPYQSTRPQSRDVTATLHKVLHED